LTFPLTIMMRHGKHTVYSLARHESRYSTLPQPIEMVIDDIKEFEIIDHLLRDAFNEQDTQNENIN